MEAVTLAHLRTLADGGAIRSIHAEPSGPGFVLVVRIGMVERCLRRTKSAEPRIFRTLDAVAKLVRQELGYADLHIRLADWNPDQHAA